MHRLPSNILPWWRDVPGFCQVSNTENVSHGDKATQQLPRVGPPTETFVQAVRIQLFTHRELCRKTAASYFIDIPCKPAMEPYRDRIAAVLSGTSAQNNHSSSKETHLCHSCATDDMFKDVDQG